MKLLIKTTLLLTAIFACTFFIIKVTGVLTLDDIKSWFLTLQSQPAYYLGSLVIILLLADLFIAIPTMTVILLSGYFLGFQAAVIFSFIGLAAAATTGYTLSYLWGEKLLLKISHNTSELEIMKRSFHKHGVMVLILSRAMPILPEVSTCLAGITRMPLRRFILGWGLGTIPYLLITSYAGSISDVDNPTPAIVAAIAITCTLWLAWAWLKKSKKL